MKLKTLTLTLLAGLTAGLQAQTISNGGFETFGTIPTCATPPSSYNITHCSNWGGLKMSYNSSCSGYTDVSGSSSGVDYFNQGTGGTSACQSGSPRTSNGYAHCEAVGYYPSAAASSEYVYQQMSGTFSTTVTYRITAYINPQSTFTLSPTTNSLSMGFCFVNTSVGSTAANILGNVRSQTYVAPTITNDAGGWVKMEMDWTPPSNATYYVVVGPMLFCNDANHSTTFSWLIDDASIGGLCPVDAGPDQQFNCSCCAGGCNPPTIGTASTGYTYSWSPTTGLGCSTCAQTTANPGTVITYTLTVSGAGCITNTDAVTVTKNSTTGCCCCSGRLQSPESGSFGIFPNPSNGIITIDFSDSDVISKVEIVDVLGRTVYSVAGLSGPELTVDLSNEAKGVYTVSAWINGQVQMTKVTLQ